ncbi:MAG: hypothetical protein K5754_15185 [Butyrivibrio sp.]|jgi:peptidoglycan/LPS O-acetylase OafA/YrhL|nr:hypothetical protein [Butyrivibrio sp.]
MLLNILKAWKKGPERTEQWGTALHYTTNKAVKLLPYSSFGILLSYAWRLFFTAPSKEEVIYIFSNAPFELLFLNNTGVSDIFIDSPLWYISSLIIALPIIIGLYLSKEDFFKNYFCFFYPLLYMGWTKCLGRSVGAWNNNDVFLIGTYRALSDIALGGGCFFLYRKIKRRVPSGRLIFGEIYAIAIYLVTLCLMQYNNQNYEIVTILLFFLVLLFVNLGRQTSLIKPFDKAFCYLGSLSMPISCLHWGVFLLVENIFSDLTWMYKLVIVLMFSIVLSLLMRIAVKTIKSNLLRW